MYIVEDYTRIRGRRRKAYVFYNPFAGNGDCGQRLDALRKTVPKELVFCDLTKEETYESSLFKLTAEDFLILCGGDGTLNQFVNTMEGMQPPCEIFYYPAGRNNDFAMDLGKKIGDKPFNITAFLRELPIAKIRNRGYRFLNGICCGYLSAYFQEARREQRNRPNRTRHAMRATLRELLLHGSPVDMDITVDGVLHSYQSVWLALTMHGRFYGGMMPAPQQVRGNPERLLSVLVLHNSGKLKAASAFPSLFAGNYIKHRDVIDVLTGREIQVEFEQPTTVSLDGNALSDADSYRADFHSPARA